MTKPYEQDVILDVEGQPIFDAMAIVQRRIDQFTTSLRTLSKDTVTDVKQIQTIVDANIRALKQARSDLNTLQQAGPNIQTALNSIKVSKGTAQATAFRRELETAATAAEGLTAKLNKVNEAIAARGRNNQFATLKQTNLKNDIEEQIKLLNKLDAEMTRVQRRSNRTSVSGNDAVAARQMAQQLADARSAVTKAALNPRGDVSGALGTYQRQLDQYQNFLGSVRNLQANRLREERSHYAAIERAEIETRNRQTKAADDYYKQTGITAAERRRQEEAAWAAQRKQVGDTAQAANAAERQKQKYLADTTEVVAAQTRAWAKLTAEERAAGQGLNPGLKSDAQRDRDALTLAGLRRTTGAADVRASAIDRAREITDLETANRLRAESAVRLGQLREARKLAQGPEAYKEASALIAAEKAYGDTLQSNINKMHQQKAAADARLTGLSVQAQKALAASDGRALAGAIGTGPAAAALTLEKERIQAQLRLNNLTETEYRNHLNNLKITEAQLRAVQQLAAEEERAARASAQPQAGRSPMQNILSPGYAAAAFARTAVYGGAAMAAYGAFNTVTGTATEVVKLEDELAKLQAISNSTDGQMQGLSGTILQIGRDSRYATGDLVKISQTLAQAGVTASEMPKVLSSVTSLATASGSTPDEAVNLVTSALGAFQLQASESARIADLMTEALNRTKLTVGQVGQAIQYVGATAFEQNISLEQLLATIGAVAQAGVRSGSTIGTGFRQFLVDLQTPSEKLTKQLERLGITQQDVDVKTRGLSAVLETLGKKGFGASQAYEGLETRAAAFYLVAKNNTDIMDDLQLSFANQGAAAIANERAMNTLTAQWQRFKNTLIEGFWSGAEEGLTMLTNLVKKLTDRMVENRTEAERIKAANAAGTAEWYNYDISGDAEDAMRRTLNRLSKGSGLTAANADQGGLGDWLDSLSQKSDGAAQKQGVLASTIADATEKADSQATKLSELDKEYSRLQLQQSELIGNQKRSQAETVTLTSRFEGLVQYLGTTKNAYLDLMQAMSRYRGEQNRLAADMLIAQASAQGQQNNLDRISLRGTLQGIQNNRALMAQLTPAERKGLQNSNGTVNDPRLPELMNEAAARVARSNVDLAKGLYEAAAVASRLRSGTRLEARANDAAGVARAGSTVVGRNLNDSTAVYEARFRALSGLDQGARTSEGNKLAGELRSKISEAQGRLDEQIKLKGRKGNIEFLTESVTALKQLLGQVIAAIKPTEQELKEAKAKAREAAAAEREAAKRPKVTQTDVDDIINSVVGTGRLGSGTRTPAEQEELYRRGVTRARGFGPRTSNHVSGVARDVSVKGMTDEQAERAAAALRARYAQEGIEAQVLYERGGKNDGTGRHIHVGTRPGARVGRDRSAQAESKFDTQLAQAEQQTAERNLRLRLQDLTRSTTVDAVQAASANAEKALDELNQKLRDAAQTELAGQGYIEGSPQFSARMDQVEDQIQQNIDDFQQKSADALIKAAQATFDRAQLAIDTGLQGYDNKIAVAQQQLNGLSRFSLNNQVPDYVRTLAENRIAKAEEDRLRAEAATMPAQIANKEAQINALQGQFGPGVSEELEKLNKELLELRANKAALDAALGADGLLPATVGDALRQAVEAYGQLNNLNATFADTLKMNMTGALETLHGGFETMFSSIITGSQTALGAFASFAQGIMKWLQQMAAKALATQIFGMLLRAVGLGTAAVSSPSAVNADLAPAAGGVTVAFGGGKIAPGDPYAAPVRGYNQGGRVTNGDTTKDSVRARLARGEWVINKGAVDSVGDQFMANLNTHGSKALDALSSVPQVSMKSRTETNVYVIPPEQKPTLSKDDVLVTMQDDMLNGSSRRLIQHIARES